MIEATCTPGLPIVVTTLVSVTCRPAAAPLSTAALPAGYAFEWSGISLQEKQSAGQAPIVFGAAIVFVFLFLAALYESWSLPLAIILIVPMCLLFAIFGVWFRGQDNNLFTQIGLVVLMVGFAPGQPYIGGLDPKLDVPRRARYLRSLFLELERLHNHLGDAGDGVCASVVGCGPVGLSVVAALG